MDTYSKIDFFQPAVKIAKLDNGDFVQYDILTDLDKNPTIKVEFLGEGIIYSINGILQKWNDRYKFYKLSSNI